MRFDVRSRRTPWVAGTHPRLRLGISLWLACLAAVASVGLAGPAGSAEKSAAAQSEPSSAAGLALPGLGADRYRITLITGDTVTLSAGAGGRYSATVDPATRPDGSTPDIEVSGTNEQLYAIPDDARLFVASGRLDRELFNVGYLAANGYADAVRGSLPVIAEYPKPFSASTEQHRAEALPASSVTLMLESIDAAGLSVSKSHAEAFWASLRGEKEPANGASLETGVTKLWLDRKMDATLDESVPQIGAPAAWAAGYDGTGVKVAVLDTGFDAAHPDLAGKVVASQSFIPGETVADGHGHGTHVAATIAGTGAAEAGLRKGVAPGADLVIGKVLSNSGSGPITRVMDGMEWAAIDQDADVINMSLGSDPTPGTDPVSRMVNQLTRDTGALFVISAGNGGPGAHTIGAPGAADSALTVAAVDKAELLAGFSSRGPRVGDEALKPDITAPGVGIVAARAAGTSLGNAVNDLYTSLNGTSMSAPHVAGAAAILAQRRPEWTATQLKPALMSTSTHGGHTVYEQGAGRVDVARAVAQDVFAATPNVDFKLIRPPFDDDILTKSITYSNFGDQPVTLALAAKLETTGGTVAPGAALSVPSSVIVPSDGQAVVNVTLDPTTLPTAQHTGSVVATAADGIRVGTPVGLEVGPELRTLTVNFVRRQKDAGPWLRTRRAAGDACVDISVAAVDGPAVDTHVRRVVCWVEPAPPQHPVTFEVPDGTYFVWAGHEWHSGNLYRHGVVIDPEFEVSGDTAITLDADDAEPIEIETPRTAEVVDSVLQLRRETTTGGAFNYFHYSTNKVKPLLWVSPTEPVTKGDFVFSPSWLLAAPQVTMRVTKPVRTELHPFPGTRMTAHGPWATPFSDDDEFSVVYAANGTAEDFAGADVRGKLALIRLQPSALPNAWQTPQIVVAQLQRAHDAGAAGVLYHAEQGLLTDIRFDDNRLQPLPPVPFAMLPAPEADALLSHLQNGRVEIDVEATLPGRSPYLYSLSPYHDGRVPSPPRYEFTKRNLAQLNASIHSDQPRESRLAVATWRESDSLFQFIPGYSIVGAPKTLPVYFGPLYDDVVHDMHEGGSAGHTTDFALHVFGEPRTVETRTHARPVAPGTERMPFVVPGIPLAVCAGCRQGDTFYPLFPFTTPQRHRVGVSLSENVRLFRDGVEVPGDGGVLGLGYTLPPEPARYRLTFAQQNIESAWDFTSSQPSVDETPGGFWCAEALLGASTTPCRAEPLIFLSYDADVALDNTVRAGRSDEIRVTAYRQAPTGPKFAGLKLWVSTNDGATWQPAKVKSRGNGVYEADVRYPRLGQTNGFVSLKAEAWDVAGNRVEQTVTRAFGLREGGGDDDDDDDDDD
jgi:subtilisin family serine protease